MMDGRERIFGGLYDRDSRFAKSRSISRRPPQRFQSLQKGDYVDINPINVILMKCREIRRLDRNQDKFRRLMNKEIRIIYIGYLANKQEIAAFTSKAKARLLRKIQNIDTIIV